MSSSLNLDQDKYILITGGAGFIGSCMASYLNELGYNNLVLVDNIQESERWKNIPGKRFKDFIMIEDLFDWLQGRESEIQAIVHLGACSDTLVRDGDYVIRNNYNYTIALAEYALDHHIKFIYASSAATYGDGSKGFSDSLTHDLRPLNLYGFSKQLFDMWALENGVLDDIFGLKYFNVYGPNEDVKGRMASVVCKWVPLIQEKGEVSLFKSNDPQNVGDGEQSRDFIYVKDAVRLTANFLDPKVKKGGLYNIGTGEDTTWIQLSRAIFKALGQEEKIRYTDMPDDLKGQYQNYTCADMTKLKGVFGVEAQCRYSVESAVKEYVQEYILKGKRW